MVRVVYSEGDVMSQHFFNKEEYDNIKVYVHVLKSWMETVSSCLHKSFSGKVVNGNMFWSKEFLASQLLGFESFGV